MKRVLVVVAHPDDEILGCGGTVARLIKEGSEAYTLILGEGATARYDKKNGGKRRKEIIELKKQAIEANKIIGVKKVFFFKLPDNRFDAVPLLDIVKIVEGVKEKIRPDIVFTNYKNDLNIDHQITYQAVITATRPLPDERVKQIYSFEVMSSTEWNYPLTFSPNIFFDISKTIDLKVKAMRKYKTEIREFPHTRSLEGVRLNAKAWGMKVGLKYAEAFKVARMIK